MAGFGLQEVVVSFAGTTVTHLTSVTVGESGSQITQEVADSETALAIAGVSVTTVSGSFAVPTSGAATLVNALDKGSAGALTVTWKNGVGGSAILTWTAGDSLSESQGVTVTSNGGSFTLGNFTINTNGGTWS